jgi:hypothetical protein
MPHLWRDGETDGLCGVMDSGEFPSTGNLRPSMLNRASEMFERCTMFFGKNLAIIVGEAIDPNDHVLCRIE